MATNPWLLQAVLTMLPALIASSGFWAYIHKKESKKSAGTKLLMGLAYDRISTLGMLYIHRGEITKDEYEEFVTYLYEPYREAGGNGSAVRIMDAVNQLPLRNQAPRMPLPPRTAGRGRRSKQESN